MIANVRNRFGVWQIAHVVMGRKRGQWTGHFIDRNHYGIGERVTFFCKQRIASVDLVSGAGLGYVLRTCEKCRREYVARYL